ncbi:MAG TPA: hypothetical protein VK369_02195 [Segetibacter sp.]|nr:hypothetical protein [Segetibacter sp.]
MDFSNPIVPGTTFIPGLYKVPCLYKADNLLGRMLRSDKRKTITTSRITLSTEAFAKRLQSRWNRMYNRILFVQVLWRYHTYGCHNWWRIALVLLICRPSIKAQEKEPLF